jgi:hypothetical protein
MRGENPSLEDCVETIAEPSTYLFGMIKNMVECKKQYGVVFVRVGKTGEGIAPNYLVTSNRSDPDGFPDGVAPHIKAYNGRSHRSLDLKFFQLRSLNWSNDIADGKRVYDLFKAVEGKRADAKRP